MAWIHDNKEEFLNAINVASERYGVNPSTIEKDYYVTIILRELSKRLGFIVFKGGTSLSKCHKAIKRFSEDIDISIDSALSEGQKKMLKNTIKEIADESFPIEFLPVHSYIGDLMGEEEPERLKEFNLETFEMKVQGIDRTLVDKVFAICDYYMQGKEIKHSRHIYDIYKLLQLVPRNEELKSLVRVVRTERAKSDICSSAQPEVNIPQMLRHIVEENVYKDDYESITTRLLEESVPYEVAVKAISEIAESDLFQ